MQNLRFSYFSFGLIFKRISSQKKAKRIYLIKLVLISFVIISFFDLAFKLKKRGNTKIAIKSKVLNGRTLLWGSAIENSNISAKRP